MSCDTCNHTMQNVGTAGKKDPLFWCPRCGTIKSDAKVEDKYVPWLVDRCKKLWGLVRVLNIKDLNDYWRSSGIGESIGIDD